MNGNCSLRFRLGVTRISVGSTVTSARSQVMPSSPCIHILYTSHCLRRPASGPIVGVSQLRMDMVSPITYSWLSPGYPVLSVAEYEYVHSSSG
eukprot:1956064-Rhodomonas_salina.1